MRFFLDANNGLHVGPDDDVIEGFDVEYDGAGNEIRRTPARRFKPAFTPPPGSKEISEAQAQAYLNPTPQLEG